MGNDTQFFLSALALYRERTGDSRETADIIGDTPTFQWVLRIAQAMKSSTGQFSSDFREQASLGSNTEDALD
jgi:hypothetical protein